MNTFEQDELIPIYVTLQYSNFFMKFPINPEEISVDRNSEGRTVDIEGLGEVNIPQKPKLATLSIESFFWHQNNLVPGAMYVNWLNIWQNSKKPAKLIVTRLNIVMEVTCENFTHNYKAGEEKDIYFKLDLKEYKPYGAKIVGAKLNVDWFDIMKNTLSLTSPVLVEIPRPSRSALSKGIISGIYSTVVGDTIQSIAKKITGKTEQWKELYDANKSKIGDMLANDGLLLVGAQLVVPQNWINQEEV